VKLEGVAPGDLVRCAIKGRTGIYGEVTEINDGVVYFRPLCPATGWRHASAREVVGHGRRLDAAAAETTPRPRCHASSCPCRGSTRERPAISTRHVAGLCGAHGR
jgi:hypothetical protein